MLKTRKIKTGILNLYTYEIGEYFTIESETVDGKHRVFRVPYQVEIVNRPNRSLDDLFHDYLVNELNPFINYDDIKDDLIKAGYDLDISHYATIECLYLPFIHFLHLKECWII